MMTKNKTPSFTGTPLFPHYAAFESTKIHGTKKDILETTRHIQRWKEDLGLLLAAGIRDLRYSVPWHRIERQPRDFDFSWIDGPLQFQRAQGMRPILDPLHHTSFPDWLTDGFANPEFPALYERFISVIAERYEWVDQYTVFNEPLPTTLFCSYTGTWYPYQQCDTSFVKMALNVAKAICLATAALQKRNGRIRFTHIDTCERHYALDRSSIPWVQFANDRRFLMHDLVLGRVNAAHPLYRYLCQHGATERNLGWLSDNPAKIDTLGLDYYFHSEIDWRWDADLGRANIAFPCSAPAGFSEVAKDYVARYRLPVMLTETNIRGTVTDRITWLRFMEEQCEMLVGSGVDFQGFCWYPSIDSTDWCHVCTQCTNSVDPQGIWYLDQSRWERHASELSYCYSMLAQGRWNAKDLPAYRFGKPLDRDLRGYLRLMQNWDPWIELEDVGQVA